MTHPYTLEDILTYSTKFEWEIFGVILFDDLFTFLFTLFLVVIGVFFVVLGVMAMAQAEDGLPMIILVIGLALLMVVGTYHHAFYDKLTPESRISYEAEEAKWEREMATPYINELPVIAHADIKSVAYNYELEVESESDAEKKRQGGKDATPVTVILKDGSVFNVWAKVVPLEEGMESSHLKYKELEQDLIFHERSKVFKEKGFFDITLYTDEEL